MSGHTLLQSFAQRQAQPQRTNPNACDACHQPRGNQSQADQVHAGSPATGWLDALDTDFTAAELNDGMDLFNLEFDGGFQGDTGQFGAKAEASLLKMTDAFGFEGLEGAAGKLGAEAVLGSDGMSIGANATWAEAAIDARKFDPNQADLLEFRVGASGSVGAGGRLHWGDQDADGRMECGYGIDAGFLSADLQSEVLCPPNLATAALDYWNL